MTQCLGLTCHSKPSKYLTIQQDFNFIFSDNQFFTCWLLSLTLEILCAYDLLKIISLSVQMSKSFMHPFSFPSYCFNYSILYSFKAFFITLLYWKIIFGLIQQLHRFLSYLLLYLLSSECMNQCKEDLLCRSSFYKSESVPASWPSCLNDFVSFLQRPIWNNYAIFGICYGS